MTELTKLCINVLSCVYYFSYYLLTRNEKNMIELQWRNKFNKYHYCMDVYDFLYIPSCVSRQ
jgi:hypothetical protein